MVRCAQIHSVSCTLCGKIVQTFKQFKNSSGPVYNSEHGRKFCPDAPQMAILHLARSISSHKPLSESSSVPGNIQTFSKNECQPSVVDLHPLLARNV
jgi:hypothetical protein